MANKKVKLDKRMKQLMTQPTPVTQVSVTTKNGISYVLALRQNNVVEVIEGFHHTVYVEEIQKMGRLLPSFGD